MSKKKPLVSSLSCQIAAEETYTTVSCNDSVVLSNRLSQKARKSENKRTCFDAGWPWGKRKSRLLWLDGIQFRSPNIFLHCGSVLTVEHKSLTPTSSISDEFEDECEHGEGTCTSTEDRSHTKLRREGFARSILPWRRAPDQRQRSAGRYIVTESQVNT